MKRTLDPIYGVPYYTNNPDQMFGWCVVYNDNAIILENDKFSNVNFKDIPKNSIKYFSLYGCGFHLICDFIDKSLNVYCTHKEDEFLYNCKYKLINEKSKMSSLLIPFQFKGFIYDAPIKGVCEEKFLINSFYLGWIEKISINNEEYINKVYFSIDTIKYPNSIGLIYKLLPKNNVYPSVTQKYRLLISDFSNTIINGVNNQTKKDRDVFLGINLKYKTIFRF